MYWYRLETSLRIRQPSWYHLIESLARTEHVVADEKHTWIRGEKAYIATTCANECVFGVSVAKKADDDSLTQAYGVFKEEAEQMEANYTPKTVNVEGWKSTQNAWLNLFPKISLILCFFHIFLGLKKTITKEFKSIYSTMAERFWNCYKATNKASFSKASSAFIRMGD